VHIHYEGNKWEGDVPRKSRLFWAQKMVRCHFTGPQKVFISRAQPPPISTSITCENCNYIFLPALFKRKLNLNFLLASLKTLTYFKNCSKSHIKFLFRLSFTLIGRFSPVYIHGTGTIFRITGGFRNNL
jgi:hypothetical protein